MPIQGHVAQLSQVAPSPGRGCCHEDFIGGHLFHLVQDACIGRDDKFLVWQGGDGLDQCCG
jgi:hypothetical protein